MVTRTSVHVSGLRELGEALRALDTKVSTRIAAHATGSGAKLIKTAAVANIIASPSVDKGSLKGAVIVKKVPKSQTKLTSEHIVTVRGRGKAYTKKGRKIDLAPHAHFVEFGTSNMPAEPFLRPAFENQKQAAVEAIANRIRTGIDAANKGGK